MAHIPANAVRTNLTRAQIQKALAFWRDRCLRLRRNPGECFQMEDLWSALQLSALLLKRKPQDISAEWNAPAIKNLEFISQALYVLEFYPKTKKEISTIEKIKMDALAEYLDWAVSMIKRELDQVKHQRAYLTRNVDLLLDILGEQTGNAYEAVEMLRHIHRKIPHIDDVDGEPDAENTVATFVWDTYLRVALLDEIADEFPRHIASVARQMHAWPMLRHRHTSSDARFEMIAERFQLGADYPLDTRKVARFRPDSPMVRYLDGLIPNLSFVRDRCSRHSITEDSGLLSAVRMGQTREQREKELSRSALDALRELKGLPLLVKSTAVTWTKKAVVPWIMATDAAGPGPYTERALEQVRMQKDIKSRAIFRSRLESKVSKTLRSLANPG